MDNCCRPVGRFGHVAFIDQRIVVTDLDGGTATFCMTSWNTLVAALTLLAADARLMDQLRVLTALRDREPLSPD